MKIYTDIRSRLTQIYADDERSYYVHRFTLGAFTEIEIDENCNVESEEAFVWENMGD